MVRFESDGFAGCQLQDRLKAGSHIGIADDLAELFARFLADGRAQVLGELLAACDKRAPIRTLDAGDLGFKASEVGLPGSFTEVVAGELSRIGPRCRFRCRRCLPPR